jgi:DNA repair exonuclease SbcCD ATPase subunit
MEGKRGRADEASDVEDVLDDLYTTPPPDFVARRKELAAAAKASGRVEDARRIQAAHRPTLAAWAANLLLRSQPEESQGFLELGRALREAYRTLDADGIRELSERRRSIVSALSGQAAQLARAAGHRLSDSAQQDIASTLRAVLADQDAAHQWATGRLENALTPPSTFPSGTATAADTPRKPPKRTAAPSPRTRAKDDLADRRRRKRQDELAQARKAAKEAERKLRGQRAEQADADAALQRARHRHDQARQQDVAAEQQLQQAHEKLQRADREQQEAEDRRQAAADALAQSEQAARAASEEVERLAASDG